MTEVLLRKVASEIEANALVAYLASQSCAATVKNRTIIAYPGIAEPPGPHAEVWVSAANASRAESLLEHYEGASLDEADLEAQAIAAPRAIERGVQPPAWLSVRVVLFALFLAWLALRVYRSLQAM